jgi:hypothetical protein
VPLSRVGDLVIVKKGAISPAEAHPGELIRWIGLGDVEEASGEYVAQHLPAATFTSPAGRYEPGNVLVGLLRPNLRKTVAIAQAEPPGLCSAEFAVLDCREGLSPEYLALMLRSDLAFGQMVPMVTGLGRPRLQLRNLLDLKIPLPSGERQEEIVLEATAMREERLRLDDDVRRIRGRQHELLLALQELGLKVGLHG